MMRNTTEKKREKNQEISQTDENPPSHWKSYGVTIMKKNYHYHYPYYSNSNPHFPIVLVRADELNKGCNRVKLRTKQPPAGEQPFLLSIIAV